MPDLTTVTLPAGLTSIPKDAFANSAQLKTVKFGTADASNGGGSGPSGRAVTGSDNAITLPTGITSIGNNAFAGTAATTMDLSTVTGLAEISNSVFKDMTKLATVTLPSTVTRISDNAFQNDAKLAKLSQDNPKQAGDEATTAPTEGTATFGSKLISIGNNAFYGTGFTTVDLSKAVGAQTSTGGSNTNQTLSVGSNAFTNMVNLTTVTLPATATNINPANFGNPTTAGVEQKLKTITYGTGTGTETATATIGDANISSLNFSKISNKVIQINSSTSSAINFNGGVFNGNKTMTTLKLNVTQNNGNASL